MRGLNRRLSNSSDTVYVATVPPSATPTQIKVRAFMRKREAGSPVPSLNIEAPAQVHLRRVDFDAATDRNVAGGEG